MLRSTCRQCGRISVFQMSKWFWNTARWERIEFYLDKRPGFTLTIWGA